MESSTAKAVVVELLTEVQICGRSDASGTIGFRHKYGLQCISENQYVIVVNYKGISLL